jgi:hypothetical protein
MGVSVPGVDRLRFLGDVYEFFLAGIRNGLVWSFLALNFILFFIFNLFFLRAFGQD